MLFCKKDSRLGRTTIWTSSASPVIPTRAGPSAVLSPRRLGCRVIAYQALLCKLALVMLCYDTVQPLVLAGRMVYYAPLSGLGLSVRAVDTAGCTINSPLLFISLTIWFILVLFLTIEVTSGGISSFYEKCIGPCNLTKQRVSLSLSCFKWLRI